MMNMPSNSPGPVIDIKDPRIRITFADVAMRVAHDGPMYGVILLVGILAMRGNVDSLHAIIGAAFALLARSRPPESDKLDRLIRGAAGAGVALVIGSSLLFGCTAARPAAYGAELQECTRAASTLTASLDCEDNVRARYGRPLLTEGERAERQPRDGGADGHP